MTNYIFVVLGIPVKLHFYIFQERAISRDMCTYKKLIYGDNK